MTAPAFVFSALLATLIGALFHFWKGGSGSRLAMMLILAWVGFFLGYLVAKSTGLEFLMIGPISGGMGAIGSILLLLLANFFSRLDQS